MKKLYFLLLLLTGFGMGSAFAQPCNAQFTTSNNGLNTVFFIPSTTPDSSITHYWNFGDGQFSTIASPAHTYANCGNYVVFHVTQTLDSIGLVVCADSIIQTLNVACNTPCGAQAFFVASMVNNQPNVYQFINNSTITPGVPFVCSWNFGDGTSATTQNLSSPTHTYTNAGVYNVCLSISSANNSCGDTFCIYVQVQVPNPATCNVVAAFTATPTSSPNTIAITNTSLNLQAGDSLVWTFGDGTYGYNLNPVHTYTSLGVYTICLNIYRFGTSDTIPCVRQVCNTVTITQIPNPCTLTPRLNYTVSPSNPLAVVFNNTTSQNVLMTSSWYFGDSTTGTGNAVTHIFQQSGTYTVCMTATVGNCVYDTCVSVTVTANTQPCNVQANFSHTNNGLQYAFLNTSVGYAAGDSLRWTFSNGLVSNQLNPIVNFSAPGLYLVCLRVTKPTIPGTAACESEYCDSIVVTANPPCDFIPSFTAQVSPNSTNTFVFTNTSGSITANASVTWNFGDSIVRTGSVVSHTFNQPGTYLVCMSVLVNNTCIKDTCKTVVVTTPCNLIANFTSVGISDTLNNLAVAFTNTSMGFAAGDSIRWTFGDGTAPSFDVNPVHIFPNSGYYTVCLRVVRNNPGAAPCVREFCRAVYVVGSVNCDTVRVSYTYRRDTYMPNRVYFYGISNQVMQSQTWTVRNLNDTTNTLVIGQYNPMHMFNETGTYEVCLSAVTVGNCLKAYCDTITINSVAQQCILTPVPNPATTQVSVQAVLNTPNTIYAFIYNAQNVLVSQRILSGYAGNNTVTLNVSNLVSGYYTIRLYHSGQMCLSRFMKL